MVEIEKINFDEVKSLSLFVEKTKKFIKGLKEGTEELESFAFYVLRLEESFVKYLKKATNEDLMISDWFKSGNIRKDGVELFKMIDNKFVNASISVEYKIEGQKIFCKISFYKTFAENYNYVKNG